MALLLYLTRNLITSKKDPKLLPRPIELYNKNIIVFGLGGIGINICERLNSFGANIYGYTNDNLPLHSFIKKIFFDKSFYKDLSKMDIIICAMPNTFRTKNFFNYKFFNKAKKGCFFINISRGDLVNTDDLLTFVKNKTLSGVGLDVTSPEPLKANHKLRKFDNVIITPHIAGQSDGNRDRSYELLFENIKRYINKQKLLNIVSKEEEY